MVKINTWLLLLSINLCLTQSEKAETAKDEKVTVPKNDSKPAQAVIFSATERVVVISEKTLREIELEKAHKEAEKKEADQQQNNIKMPNEYDKVLQRMDIDLESSVRTGFYILMSISVGALLFVGWKIYKLRLSRAERKYGVQGDRSNQELAPLPISMEDVDSEEEDQTIFDRHQIRIF